MKYWRSKKVPKAVGSAGRISEASVSARPSELISTNTGMIVAWSGTITVAITSQNKTPRNGKLSRANA